MPTPVELKVAVLATSVSTAVTGPQLELKAAGLDLATSVHTPELKLVANTEAV